ncbi:hypothetical protein C8Q76DRAFT_799001 [Earliella scabrosa]|nr:hypothetical protein C8Q76DRAFT_799001 [Earliella scabrosa]
MARARLSFPHSLLNPVDGDAGPSRSPPGGVHEVSVDRASVQTNTVHGRWSPSHTDRSPPEEFDRVVGVGRLKQCDWTVQARTYDSDTTVYDAGRCTPSDVGDDDEDEVDELQDDLTEDGAREGRRSCSDGIRHFAIPIVFDSDVGDDVSRFVLSHSPDDASVYDACGGDINLGVGLWSIPDTRSGAPPAVSYALVAHLAIVGCERKCMTGDEIVRAVEDRFPNFRPRYNGKDWKTGLMNCLRTQRSFACLPGPSWVPPGTRLWYNSAKGWPPATAPFRTPGERKRLTLERIADLDGTVRRVRRRVA